MIIWISSSNSTLLTILGNDKNVTINNTSTATNMDVDYENVTINNAIPEIPVMRTTTGYKNFMDADCSLRILIYCCF